MTYGKFVLCYEPRGEGHFDLCVCIQIHHGKISLLLVKMLGNIFCSVCVIANHWPHPRPAQHTASSSKL